MLVAGGDDARPSIVVAVIVPSHWRHRPAQDFVGKRMRLLRNVLVTVMALTLLPAAAAGYDQPSRELRRAERQTWAAINELRADRDLQPLRMARRVRLVARDRSRDMRKYHYLGHVSPSGRDAATLLSDRNVRYREGSENIGWSTFVGWAQSADVIVDAWYDSRGHRRNLLSDDYDAVGIGAAREGDEVYWTAIFLRQSRHRARH